MVESRNFSERETNLILVACFFGAKEEVRVSGIGANGDRL